MVSYGNTCNQCGADLKHFEPCLKCFLSFWEIQEDIPMQPELRQITKHQAQMHVEDTTKLHIISIAARAGWFIFTTDIEYRNFHPDTIFNQAFELMYVAWDSNLYQIMSIPINALSVAESAATRYELEMKDGYPGLIRVQGLPSYIQGLIVTVPRRIIPHRVGWAQDQLGRKGMPLRIDQIQVDMFPLCGSTIKTMEAALNATHKYSNRTFEFEEREKLKKELENF